MRRKESRRQAIVRAAEEFFQALREHEYEVTRYERPMVFTSDDGAFVEIAQNNEVVKVRLSHVQSLVDGLQVFLDARRSVSKRRK